MTATLRSLVLPVALPLGSVITCPGGPRRLTCTPKPQTTPSRQMDVNL